MKKLNFKAYAYFSVAHNSLIKGTEEKVTILIRVAYELLIATWTILSFTLWVVSIDHNLLLPLLEPILPRPVTTFYSSVLLKFNFQFLDDIQDHKVTVVFQVIHTALNPLKTLLLFLLWLQLLCPRKNQAKFLCSSRM